MININLQIKTKATTPEQEERLKVSIERAILSFIFSQAETSADGEWQPTHVNMSVTGEITLQE